MKTEISLTLAISKTKEVKNCVLFAYIEHK